MHWLRIDRYYSSESTLRVIMREDNISGLSSSLSTFNEMEKAGDNPQVSFQPVMCQHCNHAPCETVCPVWQHHIAVKVKTIWRITDVLVRGMLTTAHKVRFNWFLYNKKIVSLIIT
jgi:molybdopterin-containing oxidoreductase family iron-sulfur binding subunit